MDFEDEDGTEYATGDEIYFAGSEDIEETEFYGMPLAQSKSPRLWQKLTYIPTDADEGLGPVMIDFETTDDDDDEEGRETTAGAESNENEEESSQAEPTRTQPARQTIARQWQSKATTRYISADVL